MNGPFPAMALLGGVVIVALVFLICFGEMNSLIFANSTFFGVVFSTFAIFSNVVFRKESLLESKLLMALVKSSFEYRSGGNSFEKLVLSFLKYANT